MTSGIPLAGPTRSIRPEEATKVNFRSAILAVTALVGVRAALAQVPERTVQGLILASTDPNAVKAVWKVYTMGMPYSRLVEKLDDKQFLIEKWGARSAIVVDRKLGILAQIDQNAKLYDALLASLGPDATVRIGDLPAEQQKLIIDRIEGVSPAYRRAPGSDVSDSLVGITFSWAFSLKGPGIPDSVHLNGSADEKLREKTFESLGKSPLPGIVGTPNPELEDRRVKALAEKTDLENTVTLNLRGTAAQGIAEGMLELSKILEKEIARLKAIEAASASKLAQRFNLRSTDDPVPLGPVKPGDLPSKLLEQARTQLELNFAVNGFASKEEAAAAFQRLDSIQVFTQLGLTFSLRGRDPANGVPGKYVTYILGWFAGTPPPP